MSAQHPDTREDVRSYNAADYNHRTTADQVAEIAERTQATPDRHVQRFGQMKGPLGSGQVEGYEALRDVLDRAYAQSARGKGMERHARDAQPFTEQPILRGAATFGVGSLLFQAFKKSDESQRLKTGPAVAELLGAIVYLSAAVIERERLDALQPDGTGNLPGRP